MTLWFLRRCFGYATVRGCRRRRIDEERANDLRRRGPRVGLVSETVALTSELAVLQGPRFGRRSRHRYCLDCVIDIVVDAVVVVVISGG
jgi:hypothetical protein